nr:uncharacterized protein LOC100187392 [Phallusia mammillata]
MDKMYEVAESVFTNKLKQNAALEQNCGLNKYFSTATDRCEDCIKLCREDNVVMCQNYCPSVYNKVYEIEPILNELQIYRFVGIGFAILLLLMLIFTMYLCCCRTRKSKQKKDVELGKQLYKSVSTSTVQSSRSDESEKQLLPKKKNNDANPVGNEIGVANFPRQRTQSESQAPFAPNNFSPSVDQSNEIHDTGGSQNNKYEKTVNVNNTPMYH